MNTLVDYLAGAAARYPNRVAVSGADQELTYAELMSRSDALATELADVGVGPAQRVVLQLPVGVDLVVAIWAVLKTGAAYVPLDLCTPPARADLMIARVRPRAIIVAAGDGQQRRPGVVVIDVRSPHRATSTAPPSIVVAPDDPAYILHTSGSTGVPKGVVLTHRNATAFVDWAVDELQLTVSDRIAGYAPVHFDLSVLDLFGAAKAGATLVLVPPAVRLFGAELARFLRHQRITVLYCVPTALTMLSRAAARSDLALLRHLLFAGEICPHATLERMLLLAPHVQYRNLFGPTETNVCTSHRIKPADLQRDPLPIGRPITGVTAQVLASPEREALPGEPGELVVAGPTVAAGYWDDAAQTTARFRDTVAGRAYHTGDVVFRDQSGVLYFRGRADRQVKTRGHRVELDEVEIALRTHPAVLEAAALAVPDEAVTNRIVAAVVAREGVDTQQLRRACAIRLPSYAIPTKFFLLKQLPLTSTGKVDRTALSVRCRTSITPTPVTAPPPAQPVKELM